MRVVCAAIGASATSKCLTLSQFLASLQALKMDAGVGAA
jgi:hypothetical protein